VLQLHIHFQTLKIVINFNIECWQYRHRQDHFKPLPSVHLANAKHRGNYT
jgi:hypothetical protein